MTFLRPWFLVFVLVPILFRIFRERIDTTSSWGKVIDERLLPYLLVKGTSATARKRSIYKTIIWMVLCVALSGPAWEKEIVPTQTSEPATIIVLEISQIVSGQNLIRAQQKIYDILNHLEGEQVGLVLYDRFGYTAGPMTFELDIIRDMVPFLDSSVLPESGINPNAGFDQANRIFENAGIKNGRILFLTSGMQWPKNFISDTKRYPYKIGVLGIGSETPYPIPLETGGFLMDEQNQPVMVSLDKKKMSQLGAYHPITPDDRDIQYLLKETFVENSEQHISGQNISLWKDMGGYFVLATLPFFALLFRKGIILLLLLFCSVSAQASLWQRSDQVAYENQMLGVRNYKADRFEQAEKIFKSGKNADDIYNSGNALAFQQKIQEAIEAYKKVLQINPNHEDARYNKEYLEQKLEEEKQRQKEEQKQKEKEKKQEEQQEKLDQLENLLNQEQEQKKKEIEELEKQQQDTDNQMNPDSSVQEKQNRNNQISQLKEQLENELEQKKNQQEKISEMSPEQEGTLQQELRRLEQQIQGEIQNNQQRQLQLSQDENMGELVNQIHQENDLKRQELEKIQEILPREEKEENKSDKEKLSAKNPMPKEDEMNEKQQEPQENPNQKPREELKSDQNVFDQQSQEILNRLDNDSDSILQYRIRQQYLRRIGR